MSEMDEDAAIDLAYAKRRSDEINEALYDIKQQIRADAAAGNPRGDDWRFRAEEARRHLRNELRPLAAIIEEAARPAREAKKSAKREQLARIMEAQAQKQELLARNAEANKAARASNAFRKVVREFVGDHEYQRLCNQAALLTQQGVEP